MVTLIVGDVNLQWRVHQIAVFDGGLIQFNLELGIVAIDADLAGINVRLVVTIRIRLRSEGIALAVGMADNLVLRHRDRNGLRAVVVVLH